METFFSNQSCSSWETNTWVAFRCVSLPQVVMQTYGPVAQCALLVQEFVARSQTGRYWSSMLSHLAVGIILRMKHSGLREII